MPALEIAILGILVLGVALYIIGAVNDLALSPSHYPITASYSPVSMAIL